MIFSLSCRFLVKTIKTKCGIRLNLFLHLALPILHQPLRHYRVKMASFLDRGEKSSKLVDNYSNSAQ
ncbi:MAG: hypothetical protein LHW48_01070, partial [Candidatus Cloacimonetes bacterium]|nr:hypothetical protein [Candidatus Cloacimonadota bacterium]